MNRGLWTIRAQAWYELAQLLDDTERYDEAFQALLAAKRLHFAARFGSSVSEIQETLRRTSSSSQSLDKSHYERWHAFAENDSPYRFAVLTSHPRSGTTLVEQVLDSHDELNQRRRIRRLLAMGPPADRPQVSLRRRRCLTILDNVPPAVRQQARATYWKQTEAIFDEPIGDRMLLDKNPGMMILLPVVNWAFPEMKMLIALRDPRDVVLSCFMQKVPLTPISSNWLTLADAAEYYARVMKTWLAVRELTPSPWLEFRYEDVVAESGRPSPQDPGIPRPAVGRQGAEVLRARPRKNGPLADVQGRDPAGLPPIRRPLAALRQALRADPRKAPALHQRIRLRVGPAVRAGSWTTSGTAAYSIGPQSLPYLRDHLVVHSRLAFRADQPLV